MAVNEGGVRCAGYFDVEIGLHRPRNDGAMISSSNAKSTKGSLEVLVPKGN
jgi:hypothetical protein